MEKADGVMVGREAYSNPYSLSLIDQLLYKDPHPIASRLVVLENFMPYIARELEKGYPLKHITRHIIGLFHGYPGAKHWRRHISENVFKPNTGLELLTNAISEMKAYS